MTDFSVSDFSRYKQNKKKIVMLTAYDYPMARFCEASGIDVILVGDSLGMVVLGYTDTTKVTMQDMLHHTKAVRRGAQKTFIAGDMPFLSYGYDIKHSVLNAGAFISEGGCNAVKLEGGRHSCPAINAITMMGIPVIGHLGYTPQSVNMIGKNMVKGKDFDTASKLIEDALALEEAGVCAIVLELVPNMLAEFISRLLHIPAIGIGSGPHCDGQVLVINDILNLYSEFHPKHTKIYRDLEIPIREALEVYAKDVRTGVFPQPENYTETNIDIMERIRAAYGSNKQR